MGPLLATVLGATGRGAAYVAGFLIIGLAAFAERIAGPSPHSSSIRAATFLAARIALLLLAAHVWRLYAQTYSLFGVEEPVTFEAIRLVVLETRWGTGWMAQIALAAAGFGLLYGVRRESAARWTRFLAAALVGISFGFTGHTMSQGGSVALNVAVQAVHVLAGGTWLGTLAVLLWRRSDVSPEVFADWVARFSPMAIGAVAALLLSGTVTTITYLDPLARLWTTPYGWTLLAKVAFVLVIGGAGAYNWRVLKPRVRAGGSAAALVRTARVELVLGTVVLALTALLTGMSLD